MEKETIEKEIAKLQQRDEGFARDITTTVNAFNATLQKLEKRISDLETKIDQIERRLVR